MVLNFIMTNNNLRVRTTTKENLEPYKIGFDKE